MLQKLKSIGKKKPQLEQEKQFNNEDQILDIKSEMEQMQNQLDYQETSNIPSRASRTKQTKKPKLKKTKIRETNKESKKLSFLKKKPKEEIASALDIEEELEETKPKMSLKEKLKQKPTKSKKAKRTRVIKRDRVSIDIGSKYIKIVEGMYDGKIISIKNLATIPTPENSYLDGDITDFSALKSTLYSVINQVGITSKEAIYTMESKSIISREVELPSVNEKDIKQMMEYQVEEYFPVNLDEYVMQSKVVEEIDTEEKKESKISVSILPKTMCEEYLNLTESLNLKPIALDMNDNSIYKLLSESFKVSGKGEDVNNKTIAALDIGYNVTNIIIIENGIFRFSRLVEVGGKDINKSIEEHLDIPENEVERIKLNIGSVLTEDSSVELDSIKTTIQDALSELCDEIERIFRYHTSRSSGNKIDEIYIYGATSRMIDIEKFIEGNLNISTYKIDNLTNVRLAKKLRDAEIIQYANAIGAIMRM